MRKLFLGLLSLVSTCLLAQTKKLAFESHSGDMDNFKIALNNELFDSDNSNFGLPAPKEIKTYKLDTVIFVSDSLSVLVKREYRRQINEPKGSSKLWGVARDTVYQDALFARKHSLDSIKIVLKTTGHYINPINKVVFIGYDNKSNGKKKNDLIPITVPGDGNNNSPFDLQLLLMLGGILFLSGIGGWLSWKFYQPRLQ